MTDPYNAWIIMPILGAPELTEAAIADCLAQSIPTRLLLVNQGVEDGFRRRLEAIAEEYPERIFLWSHQPSLPSLSATWNRALRFVWETGATRALVVNNDVRLSPDTYLGLLGAMNITCNLFVTAVGVTSEQFAQAEHPLYWYDYAKRQVVDKGGPDFSCFLISKAGHEQYPFDEAFIPAFCEDLDMHRRYLLGGDGDKIFSINLPYLHVGGGSNTLKSMSPEARAAHEARIGISRAHYRAKWGGDVNQERYTIPFDETSAQDGVTTPDLQASHVSR